MLLNMIKTCVRRVHKHTILKFVAVKKTFLHVYNIIDKFTRIHSTFVVLTINILLRKQNKKVYDDWRVIQQVLIIQLLRLRF
jgi:hypothetical protein